MNSFLEHRIPIAITSALIAITLFVAMARAGQSENNICSSANQIHLGGVRATLNFRIDDSGAAIGVSQSILIDGNSADVQKIKLVESMNEAWDATQIIPNTGINNEGIVTWNTPNNSYLLAGKTIENSRSAGSHVRIELENGASEFASVGCDLDDPRSTPTALIEETSTAVAITEIAPYPAPEITETATAIIPIVITRVPGGIELAMPVIVRESMPTAVARTTPDVPRPSVVP